MRPLALRWAVAGVVVVACAGGCGGSGPSRQDVLADLAEHGVVPAYEELASAAAELESAVVDLCAAPDQGSAEQAQGALAATRATWKGTEAMWLGPVMERRSWALVDWPVDPAEVDAFVADETIDLDAETLTNRIGADQRGLGGLEHVLGPNAESAVEAAGDARRCAYLTGVAAVVAQEVDALVDGWTIGWEGGPPYRDVLGSAPDDADLDDLVNDGRFLLETMTDRELGVALGEMGSDPDPTAIVEGPAALGVADLEHRLLGLQTVFLGDTEQPGLSTLLGEVLTERLQGQFDAAAAALAAVDAPLRDSVASSPEDVAAARQALKDLQVTLATEVVSRLGVTIGFSDADGDGG